MYAELDLKTPAESGHGTASGLPVRMSNEDATEYAEIVPVKMAASPTTGE